MNTEEFSAFLSKKENEIVVVRDSDISGIGVGGVVKSNLLGILLVLLLRVLHFLLDYFGKCRSEHEHHIMSHNNNLMCVMRRNFMDEMWMCV